MSAQDKELAADRAWALVGYFAAEKDLFEALLERDGDFTHKAAADKAHANELTARRLYLALTN